MSAIHMVRALRRRDIRGDYRLALFAAADSGGQVLGVEHIMEWVACDIERARDIIFEMERIGEFRHFEAGCFAVSIMSSEEIDLISDECLGRIATVSLRRKVFARDGKKCVYCGDTQGPFELDHVHPYSMGGKTSLDNLVVACSKCNRAKGDKTLDEWNVFK